MQWVAHPHGEATPNTSVSQKVTRRTNVIELRFVERKQMTFRPSARAPRHAGNKKHQMRVTHSALGLHEPGNPRSGPKATKPSNRVGYSGQGLMVAPAVRNGVRATRWEPTGPRKREKALSMRTRKSVLLARGSKEGQAPIPWRQKRVKYAQRQETDAA